MRENDEKLTKLMKNERLEKVQDWEFLEGELKEAPNELERSKPAKSLKIVYRSRISKDMGKGEKEVI